MNYSVDYNLQQAYLFECDWYSDWDDKENHTYGIVYANNLELAVIKISRRLPYCDNLTIKKYEEFDFCWLNKFHYNRLSDESNEFMFDEEVVRGVIDG